MGWTAPITAVANTLFTSSDWNVFVRDNLNETEAAKVTAEGQYLISTGAHSLAARSLAVSQISGSVSTTSTSFVPLGTGPAITATTGDAALIHVAAIIQSSTLNNFAGIGVSVTNATTDPASESYMGFGGVPAGQFPRSGVWVYQTLTPGSNTFTMQYRTDGGTATFLARHMIVVPL